MTTGNLSIGNSSNSTFYWYRSWSGINGKLVNSPAGPVHYVHRVLVKEGYWVATKPRYARVGLSESKLSDKEKLRRLRLIWKWEASRRRFYVPPVYALVNKTRYHRVRLKDSWNAYHVSGLTGRQNKGTDPTYGIMLGFNDHLGTVAVWTSNDQLKVLSKLSDAVKKHSFDLGVSLAEGKETVQMLLTTLRRVTGAVSSLKRGRIDLALRHLGAVPEPRHMSHFPRVNPEKIRKVTKSGKVVFQAKPLTVDHVSAMWLEIQYGWRPLFNDVYEATKAYSAIADKSRQKKVSVTVEVKAVKDFSLANAWTSREHERCSRRVTYEMEEKLSTARSLNLLDPRSAAWEVLPWSFVADWFIPIGTYFSALATIPHLKGRFLIQDRVVNDAVKVGLPSSVLYKGAIARHRVMTYDRSVSTTLVVPLPVFKPIRQALSIGHMENALALLQQVVKF